MVVHRSERKSGTLVVDAEVISAHVPSGQTPPCDCLSLRRSCCDYHASRSVRQVPTALVGGHRREREAVGRGGGGANWSCSLFFRSRHRHRTAPIGCRLVTGIALRPRAGLDPLKLESSAPCWLKTGQTYSIAVSLHLGLLQTRFSCSSMHGSHYTNQLVVLGLEFPNLLLGGSQSLGQMRCGSGNWQRRYLGGEQL